MDSLLNALLSSPLGKQIQWIVLYGVGLTSVSSAVWTYGPMLEIGGFKPFENYIIRETVIVLLCAAVAGIGGLVYWRKRAERTE